MDTPTGRGLRRGGGSLEDQQPVPDKRRQPRKRTFGSVSAPCPEVIKRQPDTLAAPELRSNPYAVAMLDSGTVHRSSIVLLLGSLILTLPTACTTTQRAVIQRYELLSNVVS